MCLPGLRRWKLDGETRNKQNSFGASISTTKDEERHSIFLGIMGYYRRFIENYSTIVAPLTDLTRAVHVLSQTSGDGQEYPIAYWNRKLLPREQRYSTTVKECLAIKLGVAVFLISVYLLGRQFSIEADHRSLVWMERLKHTNARCSLALQLYQFTVWYRAGKWQCRCLVPNNNLARKVAAWERGKRCHGPKCCNSDLCNLLSAVKVLSF